LNDAVLRVAVSCLGSVMKDDPWQDMGFRKRPRHGRWFQQFRAPWRVMLERSILQEMLILFTAAHVVAGVLSKAELGELVHVYVDGPDGTGDLWATFGYPSRDQARGHLTDSIQLYVDAGIREWLNLFPQRIGSLAIPDSAMASRITGGALRFAQNVQSTVVILQSTA
jgi:hypothetical protein